MRPMPTIKPSSLLLSGFFFGDGDGGVGAGRGDVDFRTDGAGAGGDVGVWAGVGAGSGGVGLRAGGADCTNESAYAFGGMDALAAGEDFEGKPAAGEAVVVEAASG